jgi:NADPH2:quinone reductase
VRTVEERDEAIAMLDRLFSERKISMPIDRIISFAEVPEALDRLGGAVNGKLIARIGDPHP